MDAWQQCRFSISHCENTCHTCNRVNEMHMFVSRRWGNGNDSTAWMVLGCILLNESKNEQAITVQIHKEMFFLRVNLACTCKMKWYVHQDHPGPTKTGGWPPLPYLCVLCAAGCQEPATIAGGLYENWRDTTTIHWKWWNRNSSSKDKGSLNLGFQNSCVSQKFSGTGRLVQRKTFDFNSRLRVTCQTLTKYRVFGYRLLLYVQNWLEIGLLLEGTTPTWPASPLLVTIETPVSDCPLGMVSIYKNILLWNLYKIYLIHIII